MTAAQTSSAPARSLVSLLGEQRAAIVTELRRVAQAPVAVLAEHLGISEVATRRHLAVLEEEGLIAAQRVPQGRGRPPARYHLTEAADQLFPQRYDRFATDVLDFLEATGGSSGVRAFLRWRLDREVHDLRAAVTAEDLHARLSQLAGALSDAGFDASVHPDGEGFALVQDNCAIGEVARDHPEVCAFEAATFSEVLGTDVRLSRRQTWAAGAQACVCEVATRGPAARAVTERDIASDDTSATAGDAT